MSAHDHSHSHGSQDLTASRSRLAVALGLTVLVLVAEVVTALITNSLALLADAGHMLTDVAGLLMALTAAHLATRPATDQRTWGLRRAEVIGAALQAGMLGVVGLSVGVRAVLDLFDPPDVAGGGMLVMGVVGLVANVVSLLVLAGGRGTSLNMRAAFLEVTSDALGSVGVIVAAVVVWTTGWERADAVASLVIAALIVPRALVLLRSAGRVLMEESPDGLDVAEVRRHMLALDHVEAVHDLHVTQVASGLPVLTAHVAVRDECLRDGHASEILHALQECVAEHFPVRIEHSTFQIESTRHREHEHLCA